MSYPQIQLTNYYLSALADTNNNDILESKSNLTMMDFPVAGSAQTYDSTSFCPDSASTATSIASGEKTLSGVINYDVTLTTPFKLVTEYAKEAGYKIGVISSVLRGSRHPGSFLRQAAQPQRLL